MIRVYTTGVFDILHRGHFNVLTKAKELGDTLIVGVQDDLSVLRAKGCLPTLSVDERVRQLESLPFVDKVIVYKGVNQIPLFKKLRPQVVVQGDDWMRTADRTAMIHYLRANKIRLTLIPYTEGISTTEVKRRMLDSAERRDREFILRNVELLKIKDLDIYELFDEEKAAT